MPVFTWVAHHRLLATGVGVVVVVVLVAAGFWYLVLRSPGTQVGLRQALRLYRQGQPDGGVGTSTRLPPSGVYRYRTSGSEQLSVGGINRAFPGTTQMIVTGSTCATVRWEPLVQHTEATVVCPAARGALTMSTALSDESIAGTQTDEVIACPPDTYFVPPDPVPGLRWSATCHTAGRPVPLTGQVLGRSSVTVGGRSLPAIHTRLTFTFSGAETGTNPTDYWIEPGDGLILRQHETVDVSQQDGPLGRVRYHESMDATLESTTPVS